MKCQSCRQLQISGKGLRVQETHTSMPWTDRKHLLAISGGDKHSVPHVDTRGRFHGYLQAFFSLILRQLEGHAKIHARNEVRGGEGAGEAGRRLGAEPYERRPGSWLSRDNKLTKHAGDSPQDWVHKADPICITLSWAISHRGRHGGLLKQVGVFGFVSPHSKREHYENKMS